MVLRCYETGCGNRSLVSERQGSNRITELEVRAKGYREKVTFWVVKGLGIPMLLGEP